MYDVTEKILWESSSLNLFDVVVVVKRQGFLSRQKQSRIYSLDSGHHRRFLERTGRQMLLLTKYFCDQFYKVVGLSLVPLKIFA